MKMLHFLDASKSLSTMRLVALSMVWTACLYVIVAFLTNEVIIIVNAYYILHGIRDAKLEMIVIDWIGAATFAGAGLAGKATQSFAENKTASKEKVPALEDKPKEEVPVVDDSQ